MSKKPEAFSLSVPDANIADLRDRLARTRFPDQAPGPAWAYGTDVAWMRELVDHWRTSFDWRARVARLGLRVPRPDPAAHRPGPLRRRSGRRVHRGRALVAGLRPVLRARAAALRRRGDRGLLRRA